MSSANAAFGVTLDRAPLGAHVRTVAYALVVLGYLASKVGQQAVLAPLLSALSVAAILVSLPAAGLTTRILTGIFIGAGTWMLHRSGVAWAQHLSAYGEMAYLIALFAVVPVLSAPVQLGGYGHAIQAVLRGRVKSLVRLNGLATMLAFMCGSFMSMAAVPVMMASLGPVVSAYPVASKARFMAVSATYGYVLPILWTPVSGVVGVMLSTLHVDWLTLFPALFALSIAGLCANSAVFYLVEVRGKARSAPDETTIVEGEEVFSPVLRLLELLAGIVLLVVGIVVVESWLRIGIITVVTLLSIPFALAWSVVIRQAGPFVKDTGGNLMTRLPRMADQVAIFLSAGFLARAMHLSGIDHTVNLLFLDLHDVIGTQLLLILLPIMALIAAFLGVHPLVAIALLGESLKPELLGITPSQLAISLIGSSVLTYMLGPFSGTLGLVQSITQVSTFRLSMWNAPYAAAFFVLLVAATLMM